MRIELKIDIIDADHFAAIDIDYLLIEQVALQQKQSFGAFDCRPFAGDCGGARMPPLIAAMAANGSTRLPDRVFTISDETPERSSCGAIVTSRTRPAAPDGSYTVAPKQFGQGKSRHPARE